MCNCLRVAVVALSIAGAFAGTPAKAEPVGVFSDFNVLVFGDFTARNSDVQGRLAAGGDISLNNYSVGDRLTGDLVGGGTLVAGGDIAFPSGRVYYGDIFAGGSAAGVGKAVRNGLAPYGLYEGLPPPVDFTAERDRMIGASGAYDAMDATGADTYKWSQLFLTGDGVSAVQVFDVSATDLGKATNVVVGDVPGDATLIINVHGATASMSGGLDSFFQAHNDHVIFNFVDATQLSLADTGVQGSILAPLADISARSGVIWGQVVAASWNGSMQVNDVHYGGYQPLTGTGASTPVPEPAGAVLLAVGLLTLFELRRRQRSATPVRAR